MRMACAGGDVLAFQLPNWWQFYCLHIACLRLGVCSNPLMPIFRERELSFMLDFADAKALVTPGVFRGHDHAAMARELRPSLPKLEHCSSSATISRRRCWTPDWSGTWTPKRCSPPAGRSRTR